MVAVETDLIHSRELAIAAELLQQNRAQLKNAQVDLERYRGLYAEDSIAKQTLDTQEALVSQYQGTLAANQAAVNEALRKRLALVVETAASFMQEEGEGECHEY